MAEIKMVSCCTCGYEWQQGRDGSHQCSEHMAETIKRQAAEIERLRDALRKIVGIGEHADAWAAIDAAEIADSALQEEQK